MMKELGHKNRSYVGEPILDEPATEPKPLDLRAWRKGQRRFENVTAGPLADYWKRNGRE